MVNTQAHPTFGVAVPSACPGVPAGILDPRGTWADKDAYDAQARKVAAMFADNFEAFAGIVPEEVRAAGPRLG